MLDCLPAQTDKDHVIRYLTAAYNFFEPALEPGGRTIQALPKLQY